MFLDGTAHAQSRNFEIAGRWKCVRWFVFGGGVCVGFFLVGCFVDFDGGGRREGGRGLEGVREGWREGVERGRTLFEGSGARIRGSGWWRERLKGGERKDSMKRREPYPVSDLFVYLFPLSLLNLLHPLT